MLGYIAFSFYGKHLMFTRVFEGYVLVKKIGNKKEVNIQAAW